MVWSFIRQNKIGVANGRLSGDTESGGGLVAGGDGGNLLVNRAVHIPMSFSEDRLASKAGFTSSGTFTTREWCEGDVGS